MRRFLGKFSFLAAILIVAAFVLFTYAISRPLRSVEKASLVRGTIRPAAALRPDGPFIRYVALHRGTRGVAGLAAFPVDDEQTTDDGAFELSADEGDGTLFYLLARLETARGDFWCETVQLPPVQHRDDRAWVEPATQKRLEPVQISVGRSTRCD